jgi:uncharacterized membrane protein YgcG
MVMMTTTMMMSSIVVMLLLLACCSPCHAQPDADPLLSAYYTAISRTFLTSANASSSGYVNNVLVLQSPGIVVDGTRFDSNSWKYDIYRLRSPGALQFQLANAVPYSRINFIQSGSISDLWLKFFYEYQWVDGSWEAAMCLLLQQYPSMEQFTDMRIKLLREYDALEEKKYTEYRACAAKSSIPLSTCNNARDLVDKQLQTLWAQYQVFRRRQKLRLSQILAHRALNLDTLIAAQYRTYRAQRLPELGSETQLLPFYVTNFSPANWWTWFTPEGSGARNSAFVPISITASGATGANGWAALGGSTAQASLTKRLAAAGTNVRISMEVARVDILRPWLDISMTDKQPLAMSGVLPGGWSTGYVGVANNGTFPLYTTAFIVARNINITADSWTGDPMVLLAQEPKTAQDNTDRPGTVTVGAAQTMTGPLSVQGNYWKFMHDVSIDASYSAIPSGVRIAGAQIVGWLCRPTAFFPNARMVDRTLVTRCTSSYPIPIATPDPTIVTPPTPVPTPPPTSGPVPTPGGGTGGNGGGTGGSGTGGSGGGTGGNGGGDGGGSTGGTTTGGNVPPPPPPPPPPPLPPIPIPPSTADVIAVSKAALISGASLVVVVSVIVAIVAF